LKIKSNKLLCYISARGLHREAKFPFSPWESRGNLGGYGAVRRRVSRRKIAS